MAGTVNLPITITVDASNARKVVQDLQAELKNIVAGYGKTAFSTGTSGSSSDIANKIVEPIKKAREAVEQEAVKLRADIETLFKAFDTSSRMKGSYNPEEFLKDAKKRTDALRRMAIDDEGGINEAQLKEAEDFYHKMHGLTRKYGTEQAKAEADNAKVISSEAKKKLQAQEAYAESYASAYSAEIAGRKLHARAVEENNRFISASEKKLYAEQMAYGNEFVASRKLWLKKSLDEVLAYKKNETDALKTISQERLHALGRQLGKEYEILPGMSPERIKIIEKELKGLLALYARVEQEMAVAESRGLKPRIRVVADTEKFDKRQEQKWSQEVAGGVAPDTSKYHDITATGKEAGQIRTLSMFNKEMKELVTHTGRWKEAMQGVFSMMEMQARWFLGAGIIFGTLAAIRSGAMAFLEYDKALMEIQAVTRITNKELGIINDKIISISLFTPHSTTALAGLAKTLVQAGLSAGQTSSVLEDIAKTATVTGASLEQVGQVFSTAIFAWQMSAKESTSIGNTVAATLNYARLNIEDLGTAYNYVASVSNQFNISFKEMNSILAVFSNVGLRASTMATGFANILANLTKPPKAFKDMLEKTEGKYIGFVKTLESNSPTKFADALEYLEKAGFRGVDAMRTLEQRAGRELAAALNMGSAAFRKMYEDIDKTTQLEAGFNTAMDATANRLAVLKNHLTAIAVTLGTTFKPLINAVIDAFTFLGKIAFYVGKGIGEMGFAISVFIPGGLLLAAVISMIVKAWKDLNAALLVTTVLAKSTGVGFLLTIAAAVAGIVGWLKSGKNAFEDYKNTLNDTAKAAKLLGEKQKGINTVYEEAKKVVESFNDTLEHLNNVAIIGRIKLPSLYHDEFTWQIESAKFYDDLNETYETIVSLLESKMKELDAMIDKSKGGTLKRILTGLFGAITPKAGLDADIVALQKQRDELKALADDNKKAMEDAAKAAEKAADERRKKYTPEKITSDANKLFNALSISASGGKLSIAEEMSNLRQTMRDEIAKELDKGGRTPLVEAIEMLADGQVVPKEYEHLVKKYIDMIRALTKEKGNIADEMNKLARTYREMDPISQLISDYEEKLRHLDEMTRRGNVPAGFKKEKENELLAGVQYKIGETIAKNNIKLAETEIGIRKSQYAAEKNLLDVRLKLGLVSPFTHEATKQALLEAEVVDEILLKEKELALLSGKTDEDKEKIAKINKDILDLVRKLPPEEQKQLSIYEAVNTEIEKQLKLLEYRERFAGEDPGIQRKHIEEQRKLNDLRKEGIISEEEYNASSAKIGKKFHWGDLGLKEGIEGFKAAVSDGVAEAQRSLGGYYEWAVKLGRDTVDTLQKSTSDFFFALSTAQGFDKAKHKNFWQYVTSVAHDFLKSLRQSFMRTLSDIYSQWLTGGIAKLMQRLLSDKGLLQQQDISAIGTQASLTAAFMTQTGAIALLTEAYWALAVAKMAAGVGGPMMSFGGGTGAVGGESYTGQSWAVPSLYHHSGGYIPKYHSGGLAPDERLSILQTGEYVVSRRGVAALDAINNGNVANNSSQPTVNNFYISTMDAQSFSSYLRKNGRGAVVGIIGDDLRKAGATRDSMRRFI